MSRLQCGRFLGQHQIADSDYEYKIQHSLTDLSLHTLSTMQPAYFKTRKHIKRDRFTPYSLSALDQRCVSLITSQWRHDQLLVNTIEQGLHDSDDMLEAWQACSDGHTVIVQLWIWYILKQLELMGTRLSNEVEDQGPRTWTLAKHAWIEPFDRRMKDYREYLDLPEIATRFGIPNMLPLRQEQLCAAICGQGLLELTLSSWDMLYGLMACMVNSRLWDRLFSSNEQAAFEQAFDLVYYGGGSSSSSLYNSGGDEGDEGSSCAGMEDACLADLLLSANTLDYEKCVAMGSSQSQ